jgi:hypothetical protein
MYLDTTYGLHFYQISARSDFKYGRQAAILETNWELLTQNFVQTYQ